MREGDKTAFVLWIVGWEPLMWMDRVYWIILLEVYVIASRCCDKILWWYNGVCIGLYLLQVYKVMVTSDNHSWFIFRRYNEFYKLYEVLKKQVDI